MSAGMVYKKALVVMGEYGVAATEAAMTPLKKLMSRAVHFLVNTGSLVRKDLASASQSQAPKILHWPGELRKPWQRLHPRARSVWDSAWWRAHRAMCHESVGLLVYLLDVFLGRLSWKTILDNSFRNPVISLMINLQREKIT